VIDMLEFEGWPKTPRLFRDMIVTEKIDGTNAAVIVQPLDGTQRAIMLDGAGDGPIGRDPFALAVVHHETVSYVVGAQSRNRLLAIGSDNMGFAAWVQENAAALTRTLGPGRHFGEWWGHGIQRGYDLAKGDKRFALFNTHRFGTVDFPEMGLPNVAIVPVLGKWTFNSHHVGMALQHLQAEGSKAAPGFMRPEGVVVYHTAANKVFKVLIENDAEPKGGCR
jgi:hypothetical protein